MSIFVISKSKIPYKFVIFVCRSGKIFSGSQKKEFSGSRSNRKFKKEKTNKIEYSDYNLKNNNHQSRS